MINQWLTWKTIKAYLAQVSSLLEKPRLATTGWSDSSLYSSTRPNYIKVRFTDDKTEVEVYNDGVPIASGLQVYVYKGLDKVLRARHPSNGYKFKDMAFSFVKNHGLNHDYYSVDPVYVQTRSFMSLHPYVSGDWDVRVRPGWVILMSRPYWFAGETVQLRSYRPASGARFVLLSAAIQVVDGVDTVKMIVTTAAAKETPVAPDDFPEIPAGTFPVCAVRVTSARRKLYDRKVDGDLHDLRLSGSGPGGPHSINSSLAHASDITPGRLLKANAQGLPTAAANTDSELVAAIKRIDYHTEPVVFNGELLFLNNDVIVMEVHN